MPKAGSVIHNLMRATNKVLVLKLEKPATWCNFMFLEHLYSWLN